MFADVRLVAQLWLRPGNTNCGNNVTAFFLDLWENLPSHIRLRGGRADCENVIKELQTGFALPTLCLEQFWASEAALSLASLTYNLTVLFQRHLGWQQKVTLRNLRFRLFVTAGGLSHPAGKTTVKPDVPKREQAWWRRLWEKILSPFPNCNAVENHPLSPANPHEYEIPTAWIRFRALP